MAPKITTDVKQPPRFIVHSSTNQVLYLFTAGGECATIPVQQLSQINDPVQGVAFNALCPLSPNDEVVAILSLPTDLESGYLFLASREAQVKRLRIEDLPGMSSNAFKVMNLTGKDRLGWVLPTTGANEPVLITAQGQAIRFTEDDVSTYWLTCRGDAGYQTDGTA